MSDRQLQDALIRLLADAPLRAELFEKGGAGEPSEALGIDQEQARALARTDPDRVERFARFLARHFYYERIVRFYKYSRALVRVTRRYPESVVRSPRFEALFPTLVMGSRETADAVAGITADHLLTEAEDTLETTPWYRDLVDYQGAMLRAEAGPRVWRADDEDGPESAALDDVVAPVEGILILDLEWDLPAALPGILHGEEPPPDPERKPTRLLFSRTPRGQVTVLRCPDGLARLLEVADGRRTIRDLAETTGFPAEDVLETVDAVIEAGALRRLR